MVKNGNKITVQLVYELVDRKVGEVNKSISRLADKFDDLEAGRLTNLETRVAEHEGKMFFVPAIIAFATAMIFFILTKLFIR